MKRGLRFVHGDIELIEKLGRNDPCPCGSGKRFPRLLPAGRPLSTAPNAMIIIADGKAAAQPVLRGCTLISYIKQILSFESHQRENVSDQHDIFNTWGLIQP